MQVGEASPVCMIQRKNALFKAIKVTKSRSAFSWKKTDKSFHVLLKINQRNFYLINHYCVFLQSTEDFI